MILEKELQSFWIENPLSVLKNGELINTEFSLADPNEVLRAEFYNQDYSLKNKIGSIDVVFYFKGSIYAGEIKSDSCREPFWEALKIIGYAKYMGWQLGKKIKPAVIITEEKIKLEHKIVAGQCDLSIFSVKIENNEYKINFVQ